MVAFSRVYLDKTDHKQIKWRPYETSALCLSGRCRDAIPASHHLPTRTVIELTQLDTIASHLKPYSIQKRFGGCP